MALAQEWRRQLDIGAAESRADLARQLGVSRAHVTQILRLLRLAPGAQEAVSALGDPLDRNSPDGTRCLRTIPSPIMVC